MQGEVPGVPHRHPPAQTVHHLRRSAAPRQHGRPGPGQGGCGCGQGAAQEQLRRQCRGSGSEEEEFQPPHVLQSEDAPEESQAAVLPPCAASIGDIPGEDEVSNEGEPVPQFGHQCFLNGQATIA